VGNYLKEHGWNAGEPVLTDAAVDVEKTADLDGRKLVLSDTVESLRAKGVNFDSALPPEAPALLIAADESDGVHWRVGYNNFYVITRYNHSALYAMAVYELAAAMKQRILLHDAAALKESPAGALPVVAPAAAAVNAAAPAASASALSTAPTQSPGISAKP
jgi:hypothetical protein